MNNQLYRQEILEHYRNPQNFGKLKKPTITVSKVNELCGDEIILQIKLDPPKPSPFAKGGLRGVRVGDVKFSGSGCALSIASASLFTESLKGKTLAQLKKIKPEHLIKSMGVPVGAARKKCILLPHDALKKILENNDQKRNSQ